MKPFKWTFETIDIDNRQKHLLQWILSEIIREEYIISFSFKKSFSKGYHLTIYSAYKDRKKLLLFRKKYDDKKRFKKDKFRPNYSRNVLFTSKIKIPLKLVRGKLKIHGKIRK